MNELDEAQLMQVIEEMMCSAHFRIGSKSFECMKLILLNGVRITRGHISNKEKYQRVAVEVKMTSANVENAVRNAVKQANRYGLSDYLTHELGTDFIGPDLSPNEAIHYMLMAIRRKIGIFAAPSEPTVVLRRMCDMKGRSEEKKLS